MTDYDDKLWWIALGAMMVGSATSKTLRDSLKGCRPEHGDAASVFESLLRDDKAAACKWLGLTENGTVLESVTERLKAGWARRRAQVITRQMDFLSKGMPPAELITWLREKADELERVIR